MINLGNLFPISGSVKNPIDYNLNFIFLIFAAVLSAGNTENKMGQMWCILGHNHKYFVIQDDFFLLLKI